jgi:quinol monooxygenase YgiN
MKPVFELVRYKVKDAKKAKKLRREAMEHAKGLKGFVNYRALENTDDQTAFVDLVEWASLEDAQQAAQEVMNLPQFQAMMAEIESVESMTHYYVDKFVG